MVVCTISRLPLQMIFMLILFLVLNSSDVYFYACADAANSSDGHTDCDGD